jgi:hypothetical protein
MGVSADSIWIVQQHIQGSALYRINSACYAPSKYPPETDLFHIFRNNFAKSKPIVLAYTPLERASKMLQFGTKLVRFFASFEQVIGKKPVFHDFFNF